MGVPGFYSWLARRYPMILHNLRKGEVPPIDCFYLDMNGIIYKCSKDEGTVFKDLLLQRNIEEIFSLIFNYIDEMVSLVEPKKVLYLFLDGPCPRAKQNQQRSRRFQSAQSWRDLGESLRNCGFLSEGESMKNNSISTGTEFMHELNQQLHFYICKKFQQDPRWENLEVLFSGSNVPGEGEHKIINFMHQYCSSDSYDPSTTHCIYGADADLIMLGLSTHIKYVSILREEMKFSPPVSRAAKRERDQITFQMIYLNIVREYMDLEYKMSWKKVKHLTYDIERIIDDFLLICCFIGNDFLPRLYCFNIREGQFEILIQIYKDYLENATAFLNDNGMINWVGLDQLIKKVSEIELEFIGDKASQLISEYKKKLKHKSDDNEIEEDETSKTKQNKPKKGQSELDEDNDDDDDDYEDVSDDMCDDNEESSDEDERNKATFGAIDANNKFNKELFEKNLEKKEKEEVKVLKKEKEFMEQLQENYKKDNFLGKSYYYQQKLGLNFESIEDIKTLDRLITKYLEGLQFVLLYYYQGCPSWSWYFPFYYAPMTSDISLFLQYKAELLSQEIKFELSQPYPPLKQLMCIIHPENSNLLPAPFAKLLRNMDSPLRSPVDYYPNTFPIDPYGGIFSHEYIVALPFMHQDLIDRVYASIDQEKEFTQTELDRNKFGRNIKYQFNRDFPEQKIKSTLPSYYQDFSVNLRIESFDMNTLYSPPKNPAAEKLSRFPSLNIKSIVNYKIDKVDRGLQMKIKFKEEVNLLEFPKLEIPKGKTQARNFYARFPNCEKVYVTGFLTPERFVQTALTSKSSILKNNQYDPQGHVAFYQEIQDNLSQNYYKKQGLQYNHVAPIIAIVKKFTDSTRTLSGFIVENDAKFEEYFYPLELLMEEQKIEKVIQIAQNQSITQEFPLGCKVVIAQLGPFDGHTGIVQGYIKGKGATPTELEVKLLTKPNYLSDNDLSNFAKEDENFVSLKFLSAKLKVKEDILLELLDSVCIQTDPNLPSSSKLPKKLDIGLNVIRRHLNEVVPELARISGAKDQLQGYDKYQQFRYLQLSPSLCKLIVSYYNEHNIIFSAITNHLRTKKRGKDSQDLSCSSIFLKDQQDPNIELVKIYIWLMRQRESQFSSSTVASKVMNSFKIKDLVNLDEKQVRQRVTLPDQEQIVVKIDANNAIPANYTAKQSLFFKSQPFYHEVGDQAIYVGTYNMKNAPFGSQCTVVGILDDKIEVVFMQPFIGGTSLGGRCPPQRGLIVEFLEIYNLQGWNKYLQSRDLIKQRDFSWNGWVDVFQPTFREAIKTENDLKASQRKGLDSNPFAILSEIKDIQPEANLSTMSQQSSSTSDKFSKVTINKKNSAGSKGGIDIIGKDSLAKDTSNQQQQRGQSTVTSTVPEYQPAVATQSKSAVSIGTKETKPQAQKGGATVYVRKQPEQPAEQPPKEVVAIPSEPQMITSEELEKTLALEQKQSEEKPIEEIKILEYAELERQQEEELRRQKELESKEIVMKTSDELEKELELEAAALRNAQATSVVEAPKKTEKKKALRLTQKEKEFKPVSEETQADEFAVTQSQQRGDGKAKNFNKKQQANYNHFMQYQQYLHLVNLQMQKENSQKKQEKQELDQNISALKNLQEVFKKSNIDFQTPTDSQEITFVDSSQLEKQLQLEQLSSEQKNNNNTEAEDSKALKQNLDEEELNDFEELERRYLESLSK